MIEGLWVALLIAALILIVHAYHVRKSLFSVGLRRNSPVLSASTSRRRYDLPRECSLSPHEIAQMPTVSDKLADILGVRALYRIIPENCRFCHTHFHSRDCVEHPGLEK